MLNPIRLCSNIFDTKELSDADLRTFTEDHLLRLTNNNPGAIYSTLITNTTAAYNAYYGKMSSELTQSQIKEGLTVTKQEARIAVEEKVSSLQGLIKYKFGESSAVYQEFYPQGMDYFYKAKDGDLELRLDSFQAAAVTHLTADYPAEVTAFTNLNTAFKNALAAQNNALSLIDNLITGKNTDRKALTVQLSQNLLIIASNNIDLPDQFDDYYDPSYLPISEAPVTFNGTVDAGSIINAVPDGHISRSSILLLKNTGPVDLVFCLDASHLVINATTLINVPAGQEYRTEGDLPVLAHYFLNIQNPSATENGAWHVEVS